MNKIRPVDKLYIAALIILFLTVGMHVGDAKDTVTDTDITITAERGTAYDFSAIKNKEAHIDGKYPCEVALSESGIITISCRGRYTDSGVVICGAKYVALNQPLTVKIGEKYEKCRIISIKSEAA